MILDLNFINGDTKRNVPCLMVEYHDGVLDVYYNYQQYLDHLPDTMDTLLSFKIWPDLDTKVKQ